VISAARTQRDNLRTIRLCSACASGDLSAIQAILSSTQIEVNRTDYDTRTPLLLAARCGNLQVVELLIASQADVNVTDRAGRTPLQEAQDARSEKLVELLLERGAEMPPDGVPVKMCAAAADPNGEESLRFLLSARAQPSVKCASDLRSPLHVAAAAGNAAQVKLLIDANAALDEEDVCKSTPLHEAFMHGHDSCSELLLAAGASMGSFDAAKALCDAAFADDVARLQRILRHKCDVNAANYDGRTPLHVAAGAHRLAACNYLMTVPGLDKNHEDQYGETPFDIAHCSESELKQVIVTLISAFGGCKGSGRHRSSAERSVAEQAKAVRDMAQLELLRQLLLKAKRSILWANAQLKEAKGLLKAANEAICIEDTQGTVLDVARPQFLLAIGQFARGHRERYRFISGFVLPVLELWQQQADQYASLKLELHKQVRLKCSQLSARVQERWCGRLQPPRGYRPLTRSPRRDPTPTPSARR
jgi:ankyrin repeat protein